jgi:bacterioferritin (cytochrome b1)
MGILERISRLVIGGAGAAAHDATEALRQCYVNCVRRARQLARHAEMAPQAYSMESLKELVAAEEGQAERLRKALRAAEALIPNVPTEPLPGHALNHWGRLVQDLELHRSSMRRLRELAVHFAETLPATAELFDELCREETAHCERLRTLIARADPQALD